MPAPEPGGRNVGAPSAKEVIARLQELVDARPAAGEISLEWAVKAQFLGDVNGLVALALREDA